jgi:hypothetical protein
MMQLIETSHLESWAGSITARSRLPYLIRELIYAVIKPDKLRIPIGDAVWLPGYDGVVANSEQNRFVPTGFSVWELGTSDRIKSKADEDYAKRSQDNDRNPGFNHKEVTFVFVTPRVWRDKEEWIAERKAEDIWRDVMVIDGVDLQNWLEVAPAVNLQFAAELGRAPAEGLQIPEQAWQEWSMRTDPPCSEEIVIAGRQDQERELIGYLLNPPSVFTVRGHSPSEAWGFVLAVLRGVDEERRLGLHARTIVADNEDVAGRLSHLSNLIIVLKQTKSQVSGSLSTGGCHVIIPEGNDARSERNVVELQRPPHRSFVEGLTRMGLEEEAAERTARECGLSITILQRQRAHSNFARPSWAEGQSARDLLPALLAGRWNNANEADQEILCRLAATANYGELEGKFLEFVSADDPPLRKIGDMWSLTAPVDTFQLVARRLTSMDLERFKIAFRTVFGRIDPRVEMPPDEWVYYDLRGESGHSGWLRNGMAEALLLISERGSHARLNPSPSPRAFVNDVVRGLPGLDDDWRVVASIRDQYARMMEAAPDPLLDGLERLLEAKPDDVRKLFVEGRSIFGGRLMYTGLLWGLETIAWIPEYLPRVVLTLSKLASLDPGGQMNNRPINSLVEIFLWWHLGTNASSDQRLAAIDLILAKEPDIGWALLAKLLPRGLSQSCHGTVTPRWRDFGDFAERNRTRRNPLPYTSAIIDRALDRLDHHAERWSVILHSLAVLNAAQQERAFTLLTTVSQDSTPADLRVALWEMLRDFVHQHRVFQGSDWALTEELIARLDVILSRFSPDDPVELYRWLFDEWLPDLPNLPLDEQEGANHEREVGDKRRQAVEEIFRERGTDGLVKLGTISKFSGAVAVASLPMMANISAVRDFVEKAISLGEKGHVFAGQISGEAQGLYGEEWRGLVRAGAQDGRWSPTEIAFLVMWWPEGRGTWEDIESLGEQVVREYWQHKRVVLLNGSAEDRIYQIDRLIEVGRAAAAFDRVVNHEEGLSTEVLMRLFDATFEEIAQAQTNEDVRRLGVTSHDVSAFLNALRRRSDLPRVELVRREYRALPILGTWKTERLTLHEFMAEYPAFFVEVLCEVFLPANRDRTDAMEPTPEAQTRAQVAYSLLESMVIVPGTSADGQLDEERLQAWIDGAREKAIEMDRAMRVDLKIGEILALAPIDPEDGGWPHRVVRNVIDRLANAEIDRGVISARRTPKTVYAKSLYEGGSRERGLASEYRGWADITRTNWPRTTRILETIARSWEEWAHHEDVRARQEELGDL